MKRKALGKGLAALLPQSAAVSDRGQLVSIDPKQIDPNPNQPRQTIDSRKLEELARSITEQGIVQPLVVRRTGSRFQLIAGERRWRASQKANLTKVPAIIRNATDAELLEIALVENIQREELNPIEEAGAYRRLISELGYSQEQVANRVGKDRSTIANLLRLLRLPSDVRIFIAEQKLSPGHARPLLSLESAEAQVEIAHQIVNKGLSVRDVERRVKAATETASPQSAKRKDPNTREAEGRLEHALGTKVRIRRRGKRGRLDIEFYSEDDLQRIYETVLRGARGSKAKERSA